MAFAEYPKTSYYDTDLGELIGFYKKVAADYDGILKMVVEVNDRLTKYQQNLPKYTQVLVDTAIRKYVVDCENMGKSLKASIDSLRAEIENRLAKEISDRESGDAKLWSEINRIDQNIEENNLYFERKFSEMRLMILAANGANRKLVDDAVAYCKNLVDDLPKSTYPVFNHIRGELDTTDNTIADIYNYGLTTCGFTAGEWHKETHITCQFFNDSEVTCLDYWTHGKTLLGSKARQLMVFSPVTGEYATIERAFDQLANYVKEYGITAGKYDSKELTAEEYDSKELTGGEYDFNAKGALSDV